MITSSSSETVLFAINAPPANQPRGATGLNWIGRSADGMETGLDLIRRHFSLCWFCGSGRWSPDSMVGERDSLW